AARVGWPLAQRGEMLAVLPASYRAAEVREALDRFETVCLLKVPQAFPEVAELLARRADCEAGYLENVTAAAGWVTHDLASVRERDHYFALVLVRRRRTEPAREVRPGRLWVVGLGPGDARLLTAQAEQSLRFAEVIIGYNGYLQALR